MLRGVRRVLACGAALLALAAGAAPARAQQDTSLSPLLLELRIDRGRARVVQALSRDSVAFVPLADFLDLAGLPAPEVVPGVAMRGWIEPEHVPFAFDTRSRRVTRGAQGDTLPGGAFAWQDGALFVAVELLDLVFGVRARMEWSDLAVTVTDADSLPSVRRAARLRRREAWTRFVPPPPAESLVALPRAWADGAALDWSVTGTLPGLEDNAGVQFGLGAQLAGGGLEVQHQASRGVGGWEGRTSWTWLRAFPYARLVRQLRAGETSTDGIRPRIVRGGVVTNAPYLRPALFDVDYVRGQLPLGWEAEVHQMGRLLSYASLDSLTSYSLPLPLVYGANPLEQIVYGPSGEVRRRARAFYVPPERLARGRFEYSVGGGECRFEACDAVAVADLRHGVSSRLTVQGGVEGVWGAADSGVSWHPYALAAYGLTGSLNLIASTVREGYARGRVMYDPSPDVHADLEYTLSDTTPAGRLYTGGRDRHRVSGSLFLRPGVLGGRLQLQSSGWFSERAGTTRHSVRAGAALRFGGGRIAGELVQDGARPAGGTSQATSGVDATLNVLLMGPWNALRRTLVNATFRGRCDGEVLRCPPRLQSASVGVGRSLRGQLRLDLQARWQRGTRGVSIDAMVTAAWPTARLVSRTTYLPGDDPVSTQMLEGSVLWDRSRGRLAFSDGRALGRGGLAGVVFLDRDGDGWMDDDEDPLADVLLRVGPTAVRTDSLGRWSASDLMAFERTTVELDSLSLGNPLWVPVAPRIGVSPTPNSFQFVPVPVVEGGEVSGQVTWGPTGRGMAGVRVQVRHLRSGVSREAVTFSDGSFYLLGVTPGPYELTIPAAALDELRARVEPVPFDVGRGDAARVEGLTLRLERANGGGGR